MSKYTVIINLKESFPNQVNRYLLLIMENIHKMKTKIKYEFTSKMWQYSSPMAWYFVSLPIEISTEIRENLKWMEEGWGRLKATAKIANTQWETAIWFDTKQNTYLLPLKAEIRKKEKLDMLKEITITIWL